MAALARPQDLLSAVGADLGSSRWITLDQDRMDQFAACTDDQQRILVDPQLARNGPFGSTIAHGYFAMSLAAPLLVETEAASKPACIAEPLVLYR